MTSDTPKGPADIDVSPFIQQTSRSGIELAEQRGGVPASLEKVIDMMEQLTPRTEPVQEPPQDTTQDWTKEKIISAVLGCRRLLLCPLCHKLYSIPPGGQTMVCADNHPQIEMLIMIPAMSDGKPVNPLAILEKHNG